MDDLDHKILQLLAENARIPVKDIAQRVSLTNPAVSSRIHRLEQEGVIGGYTVVLRHPDAPARVEALISVLVDAATRASFLTMIEQEPETVRAFLAATEKGYRYAIENPEEAAGILHETASTYDLEMLVQSQELLATKYMEDSETWGTMKEEVWTNYTDFMLDSGLITVDVPANECFTNEFLPQ